MSSSIKAKPSTAKRKIPLGCLVAVGVIVSICCIGGAIEAIINPVQTPTPDTSAVYTQAVETAIAGLPTATATYTLVPTYTPPPTAEVVLATPTLYVTETLPPNCLAAYPDYCILPGERVSCDQLPKNFTVLPPDPLGYDGDGDGLGCED